MQSEKVRQTLKNTCQSPGCKNKCRGKNCSTCRSRKTREANPLRAYFFHLRNRAKQRPKEFGMTMEEWLKWAKDNDFVPYQGDSVDRIDNERGYFVDNIQKMPLIDNIHKYHDYDKHQQVYTPVIEGDEQPF